MSGVQGSPRASMLLNQLARGELNSSLGTIGEHSVAGATSISQPAGSAAGSVSGERSPALDSLACMVPWQRMPPALLRPLESGCTAAASREWVDTCLCSPDDLFTQSSAAL